MNPAREGINVIGHISSPSGQGVSSRNFIRAFREQNLPVAVLDVDYGLKRTVASLPEGVHAVERVDQLPYRTNLICVSINLLPKLFLRQHPDLHDGRFVNAGLIFWELPKFPRVWLHALRLFDVLVACSPFVRQALETQLPEVPTVHAEHPLYIPDHIPWDRGELGFDASTYLFSTSFDLGGDINRKNPAAIVRAFQAAFPRTDEVGLVLKGNGTVGVPTHPALSEIERALSGDHRIRFISETIPYERVISLYACCDAYVSMHRAEGLGLGPLEAMMLGLATVATGYSGNMNYMTPMNSWPVRYRLVPTSNCNWQYSRAFCGDGAWWAEPDERHAVSLLQELVLHPEIRQPRAKQGQRETLLRHDLARRTSLLEEIEAAARNGPPRSDIRARARALLVADLFDPMHLKMRFQRLLK